MASKKRNALKHGANVKEVMLWSERYEDYESLKAGLNREYSPDGTTEEYLVQTMVDLLWRRQRLDRHGQITIQKQLDKIREVNEASRHCEVLCSVVPEFREATTEEEVVRILDCLRPIYKITILQDWPLQTHEDPATWGAKIAKGIQSDWGVPAPRHEKADEFMAIIDLDAFDISLARIERLDAMIDRTIKRLMQVKTMKQMYGRLQPKLINLSTTENLPLQDGTDNRLAH
jgi:hypothetical protein